MTKNNINYINKDFNNLRSRLIEYAKNYFPDTYSDFSETSPGMMFINMASYVGDILSFYQDVQVQETFLQYAKNPANLYNMAYMMGYKPKVTTVSEVDLSITQVVDATTVSGSSVPDYSQAVTLPENTQFNSNTIPSVSFLTANSVNFAFSSSIDPTIIEAEYDSEGNVSKFYLTKTVKAKSGTIKSTTFTFGEYQKFATVTLRDQNIVGVLEIKDSDNNIWTEVPCLGQDTVFKDQELNSNDTGAEYALSVVPVSRRFVTRFDKDGNLKIQFGAGMYADDTEQSYLPNPTSLAADIQDTSSERYDLAYDPSNFLFSKSYGLAPTNTVLTVKYIVGGGLESNVPASTIVNPGTGIPSGSTIYVTNNKPATGGRDGDSIEDVRQNSLRAFAEQKRVVTLKDYTIRALALPSRYGNISKAYAANEALINTNSTSLLNQNNLNISLYVLCYDNEGKLVAASDLIKNNLSTYMKEYMMLTDTLSIKDAYIVNIGVQYDVVIKPSYTSRDVLLRCNKALQEYLSTENRYINEALDFSEAYNILNNIEGVQVIKSIKVINKQGTDSQGNVYSNYAYDTDAAMKDNILYPSYDPSIFEVKYPDIDIEGRVTTI